MGAGAGFWGNFSVFAAGASLSLVYEGNTADWEGVLLIGTPVAMVVGTASGAVAGGVLGAFKVRRWAPLIFGAIAALYPAIVAKNQLPEWHRNDDFLLLCVVAFWFIGRRAGQRFADRDADRPARLRGYGAVPDTVYPGPQHW